jgi:signal transduction histidine kinase
VPGQGWEFEVPLRNGQTVFVQLPRPGNRPPPTPAPSWWQPPYNFLALLVLVAGAVALGAYPIVRRLTKRLEALQQGVERWGEGDLGRRLPEDGQDEVAFLAQRFNVAAARVQALLLSLESQPGPATRAEIARDIRELDQLIDEILLASRLDASPDDLGPLEPVDLVGLAAEECARTGAEFETPPGVTSMVVTGLTRLLRRALRNLLENARRHGAGTVTLTLRTEGGHAEIRVCDQGPGVPSALRERIFEPFFRLPGASEREGGVGLGLALVRSITQRHGGSVHCEENPGGGACFVLRLPLAR